MNTATMNHLSNQDLNLNTEASKAALIIGCTGAFGSAVAKEMLSQGWEVKALMRDPSKRPSWLSEKQITIGDCKKINDVESAVQNVGVIVYGANPIYTDWHNTAESMLEPTALLAEKYSLHILFPGNVYSFDPVKTPIINENSEQNPVTDKGEIRQRMEQRLEKASQKGATITLVRIGDFLAKNAENSMFNHLLTQKKNVWSLANPSPQFHEHSYAWLPDVAKNAVALVNQDTSGFNVWNEPGIVATHQLWISIFNELRIPVKSKQFPWWVLKIVSVFNPMMREVLKMRYLWQKDLLLDGTKMRTALGNDYKSTPLSQVVSQLIKP